MTKPRGFHMPPVTDLNWYGVDLDNTLAEDIWRPEATKSFIGDPIEENIVKLMEIALAGGKIHIHTARPGSEYAMIEGWLRYHELPYNQIQTGKPLYRKYIDDRAVNASASSWL